MGRRGHFPELPVCDNLFLQSLVNALARRRKSLAYGSDRIELTCEMDKKSKVAFERLDLEISTILANRVHLTVWEDSKARVWIGRHKKKVGWVFELSLDLDLWGLAPGEIVQRLESTLDRTPMEDRPAQDEDKARLQKIWSIFEGTSRRRKK